MRIRQAHQFALLLSLTMAGFGSAASRSLAKGLDELSDQNPEEQSAKGEEGGSVKAEKEMPKGALSKSIAEKLFVGTSYGWVSASRSGGTWKGSGMSDLTVGYKLLPLGSKMSVAGTYRYAPIAVSGTEDGHNYRGVWEEHNFGGRLTYIVTPKINAIGSAELGYVVVHVNPTNTLPPEDKASANGFALNVGGGADFMLADKWAFAAGPRVNIGVGSFTTVQVAAAAGFMF